MKPTRQSEEYFGLKLQNSNREKLNIYFTSRVLFAFQEVESLIQGIKYKDFYEYAAMRIENRALDQITFRCSETDRSEIYYTLKNKGYSSKKLKCLCYSYRKINAVIDEIDLWTILNLIRLFINSNLPYQPKYEYITKEDQNSNKVSHTLKIGCNTNAFIEIKDNELITQIEKNRIIDDLWLVMHHVIDKMPIQEESMAEKEVLLERRRKYFDNLKT